MENKEIIENYIKSKTKLQIISKITNQTKIKEKIQLQCECGNIFDRSLSKIKTLKTKYCHKCKSKRNSYINILKYIKSKKLKLISKKEEYFKTNKLELRCECGNVFKRKIKILKKQEMKKCDECINKKRYTKVSKSLKKEITKREIRYLKTKKRTNISEYNKNGILKLLKDKKSKDFIKNYFNISLTTLNRNIIKYNIKTKYLSIEEEIINKIKEECFKNNIDITKINIEKNNRKEIKPFEIDILITINNQKIAIEYNGLMFHSFGESKYSKFNNLKKENKIIKKEKYLDYFNNVNKEYKEKEKHILKMKLCEEKNIKLFSIYDVEWLKEGNKKKWLNIIVSEIKYNIYGANLNIYTKKKENIEDNKNLIKVIQNQIDYEKYKIKEYKINNSFKIDNKYIYKNNNKIIILYNKEEEILEYIEIEERKNKYLILDILSNNLSNNEKIQKSDYNLLNYFIKEIRKEKKDIYIILDKRYELNKVKYIEKNNYKKNKEIKRIYLYNNKEIRKEIKNNYILKNKERKVYDYGSYLFKYKDF